MHSDCERIINTCKHASTMILLGDFHVAQHRYSHIVKHYLNAVAISDSYPLCSIIIYRQAYMPFVHGQAPLDCCKLYLDSGHILANKSMWKGGLYCTHHRNFTTEYHGLILLFIIIYFDQCNCECDSCSYIHSKQAAT